MLEPGILGLVPLGFCLCVIVLISVELAWVQHHDGEMLRHLRGVFSAVFFLLLFPFTGGIANIFNEHPLDRDLTALLDATIWVARAVLGTALVRFWLALHHWGRKMYHESKGQR